MILEISSWIFFDKTSVPEFNSIFTVMKSQVKIDATTQLTVDRILLLAETNYHDMKERGMWNTPTAARGLLTCWNCNEEGHSAKACTKPKNESNIQLNKEKFEKDKSNRNQGGRGDGRSGRGGRGRGRGSGRGKGRSSGRHTSPDKTPLDIMKTPPMKKGLTTMNIGGTTHYWCHKCSCWNTDHLTADHPANSAATNQETTVPSTPKSTNVGIVSSSFRDTIFNGTRGSN
jgi:hypothetical protein